jgi:host factor-I protein
MAAEKSQNIQDVFLNTVRKEKVPVTVFLVSGVKLQGTISGFDNFCLVLRRAPQVQLVYKHAIATIVPTGPVSLYKPEDGDDAPAASSAPAAE